MPPGRLPTSSLPLKTEVLQILLALAAGPLHGYALMSRIEEDSGGAISPQAGAFYRTVRNMLVDGLIEECDDPDKTEGNRRARYVYRVTALGRSVARAEVARLQQVVRLGRSRILVTRPRS